MQNFKQCIVGRSETLSFGERKRCKNNVRNKENGFEGSPSFCEEHHRKFKEEREEFLKSRDLFFDTYGCPEPSTRCKGCGDFSMCPGLENEIVCGLCENDF